MMPTQAMLLAAGLGTRMRPLTDQTAKPLVTLNGRALLDHALDRLGAAGVTRVVINTHWMAAVVVAHVARRVGGPEIVLRHEPHLLDTGGAVVAAVAAGDLRPEPFFVLNGDAFWLDGPRPALARLAHRFDPDARDGRLLLHRTCQIGGEVGPGDFALDPLGIPRRRREQQIVPYLYAGIQLATPALFADPPGAAFSTNRLWDRALAAGRLDALVHDGLWFHLSTPQDLAAAEVSLIGGDTGETR